MKRQNSYYGNFSTNIEIYFFTSYLIFAIKYANFSKILLNRFTYCQDRKPSRDRFIAHFRGKSYLCTLYLYV